MRKSVLSVPVRVRVSNSLSLSGGSTSVDSVGPSSDRVRFLPAGGSGVFAQVAEHAPLWTHGRRKVSVYIPVPRKTSNCSRGFPVEFATG